MDFEAIYGRRGYCQSGAPSPIFEVSTPPPVRGGGGDQIWSDFSISRGPVLRGPLPGVLPAPSGIPALGGEGGGGGLECHKKGGGQYKRHTPMGAWTSGKGGLKIGRSSVRSEGHFVGTTWALGCV
jgi:hypothetical protein